MLFVRIRSALAEYEAYEQEIVLHAARAAVVQQHAMMLSVQQLSIARYIPTLPSCVHILNALYNYADWVFLLLSVVTLVADK